MSCRRCRATPVSTSTSRPPSTRPRRWCRRRHYREFIGESNDAVAAACAKQGTTPTTRERARQSLSDPVTSLRSTTAPKSCRCCRRIRSVRCRTSSAASGERWPAASAASRSICWPPSFILPLPPPTRTVGIGQLLCLSLLPMFDPYKEDRMIQHRAVSIFRRRHLLQEFREALHVPRLDLHQLFDLAGSLAWCEMGWKDSGNADVVVGLVRAFRHHDVGNHAREVGLVGDRDQIENQVDLLVEVVARPDRALRNLHAGNVGGRR